ncbi:MULTISPECIES: hypothetical protein [unclassified Rhizobium]|uniref:hypothetical protein n=1 Tax=unclassified Rhizobium TaxID=2613769 RepID=UPI00161BA114|nr:MULTISPECIES: hypothetical protein [unclassified Rhizobium]MBB3318852.1 hypothetical protein [Rhizobium sp. BK181]MCS4096702.1 hypothetical protein [Rhizobium sp. BK176]
MTITKEAFFNPAKLSDYAKATQVNSTVRNILEAEAAERDKKTQKLRALRLAQPVVEPSEERKP